MCTTTQLQTPQKLTTGKRRPLFDLVLPTTNTTEEADSSLSQPSKKRRITFTEQVVASYHPIPARSELSQDELDQCYYKKSDLKVIKNQATKAMRNHEIGLSNASSITGTSTSTGFTLGTASNTPLSKTANSNAFCCRGLERRSRQGAKKFRQNKTKGWRAVFLEQARQRTAASQVVNGKVYLAKLYQEVTHPSLRAAREVAARDAQEAAQIYLLSSSLSAPSPTAFHSSPKRASLIKAC